MGKYEPLFNYLSDCNKERVILSFEEIEKILQFALPKSAYQYPAWWANEKDGRHVHCKSWLEAGYQTHNTINGIANKEILFIKI